MKNVSYLFLAAITVTSVFTACKKTETPPAASEINVVQVQNALVVEPTATWCGPCGTYGKPATDIALQDNAKAFGIYAHLKAPASDFASQLGQDLAVMYGAANATGTSYSIPKIGVGNNVTGAYADINYTANILKGWINNITSGVSKANTKIDASISGNTLTVKTNTKFFANGDDSFTYKIALYLTEDGISNRQYMSATSSYQTIIHNHVSRALISGSATGDNLLASGLPTAGQIVSKDYTLNLDAAWNKSNLSVLAVIWKQKGTALSFVNVDKIDL